MDPVLCMLCRNIATVFYYQTNEDYCSECDKIKYPLDENTFEDILIHADNITEYKGKGRPKKSDKEFKKKEYEKKQKKYLPPLIKCSRCESMIIRGSKARHLKSTRCNKIYEYLQLNNQPS